MKFEESEMKCENLENDNDQMKHQIKELLAKLREVGGDSAVQEAIIKIKLTAPAPKRKKKLKAYERLYQDAQRRILDMRTKQEAMKRLEEESLRDATKQVKDRSTLRQAEML